MEIESTTSENEVNTFLKTTQIDLKQLCCRDWDSNVKLPPLQTRIFLRDYANKIYKILTHLKNNIFNVFKFHKCRACHSDGKPCYCRLTFSYLSIPTLKPSNDNTFGGEKLNDKATATSWTRLACKIDQSLSKIGMLIIGLENTHTSKKLRKLISIGVRNNQNATENAKWITYCAIRPFDCRFYIGQTSQTMNDRRYTHLKSCLSGRPEPVYKTFRASGIGSWTFVPIVSSPTKKSKDSILYLESQLIRLFEPALNVNGKFAFSFSSFISSRNKKQNRQFKYQRNKQIKPSNGEREINANTYLLGPEHGISKIPNVQQFYANAYILHFANPLHSYYNNFETNKFKNNIPVACRLDAAYVSLSRRHYETKKVNAARKFIKSIVSSSDLGFIYRKAYKFAGNKKLLNLKHNNKSLFPDKEDQTKIFGHVLSHTIKIPLGDRPNVRKQICNHVKKEVIKINKISKTPFLLKLHIKNEKAQNTQDILVNCTKFCKLPKPPTTCMCHDGKFDKLDKLDGHILTRVSNLPFEITGIPQRFNSKCRLVPSKSFVIKKVSNSLDTLLTDIHKQTNTENSNIDYNSKFKNDQSFFSSIFGIELETNEFISSFEDVHSFKRYLDSGNLICTPCDKSKGDLVIACDCKFGEAITSHYVSSKDYKICNKKEIEKSQSEDSHHLYKRCEAPKLIQQNKNREHAFGVGVLWYKSKNWRFCPVTLRWILIKEQWDQIKYKPLSSYASHYYAKTYKLASRCINAILRRRRSDTFVSVSFRDHFNKLDKFNKDVKQYKKEHGENSLGAACVVVRDVNNFFNKMDREEGINYLTEYIDEIKQLKPKAKTKYVGVPVFNGEPRNTEISGCKLDSSAGMLRDKNLSGKNSCFY